MESGLSYHIGETNSKLSDGQDKLENTQDDLKDDRKKMQEDIRNMFTQFIVGKGTMNENTLKN